MGEFLIIDGYNVINAWPDLIRLKEINFEHARLKLIDILSDYAGFKGIKTIIVFDAHQVKGGLGHREEKEGLEIIYTPEDITADMVIEKLVSELSKKEEGTNIYVATSDKVEQDIILGKGAYRISSRELLLEVKEAKKQSTGYYKQKNSRPYSLDSHLDENIRIRLERMRRG